MKRTNVSIIGLDHAGKTVIRNYLFSGTTDTNVRPTLTFDIGKYTDQDLFFSVVDFPGQTKFRKLWPQQFGYTKVMIFVLDTSEPDRYEEADKELTALLDNELLDNVPLIFLYNKIDKKEAKDNFIKAKEYFELESISDRNVFVFETSIKKPGTLDAVKNILQLMMQSLVAK